MICIDYWHLGASSILVDYQQLGATTVVVHNQCMLSTSDFALQGSRAQQGAQLAPEVIVGLYPLAYRSSTVVLNQCIQCRRRRCQCFMPIRLWNIGALWQCSLVYSMTSTLMYAKLSMSYACQALAHRSSIVVLTWCSRSSTSYLLAHRSSVAVLTSA